MTRRSKRIIIIAVIIVIVHAIGIVISGILFSTPNFYKSGYAVCRVMNDGSTVIELKDGVFILGNQTKLSDFFEENGYTELYEERMGAIHTVVKGNDRFHATVTHNNAYYAIVEIGR